VKKEHPFRCPVSQQPLKTKVNILVSLTDQKKRIADIEPAKIPKIAMREKLSLAQQLGTWR
jgi:hypothetical protein